VPSGTRMCSPLGCLHWREMPSGGHFAAAEEPALLAADVAAFFRPLR